MSLSIIYFCMAFFIFAQVYEMLRFDKATYMSLLFFLILFQRWSNSLWESDVLLFLELINIVSILYYNFIEFIILLYCFFSILFSQNRQYGIWRISFDKFWDVIPTFTRARAIVIFEASLCELIFWKEKLILKHIL